MNSGWTIFSRMRARLGVVALLVYQAFFLNVFLPGHTRGTIRIDGAGTVECGACCASKAPAKDRSSHEPTEQDKENCAVCHFAVRMTTPPAVVMTLPKLGLLEPSPLPLPQVANSLQQIPIYLGRGPPGAA